MRKTFNLLVLLFVLISAGINAQELADKLKSLPKIVSVEKLASDVYTEKYVVKITQPLDHKNPSKGEFTQRVIVAHIGYDRPVVMVTEGYGAGYALNPRYQEELSKLLNANLIFVEHRYFLESTPSPCDWTYLNAENSAYDLHNVNQIFKMLYPDNNKWITTGISKGGQTTCIYRAYFPDDVNFSVPYVAPLNRGVEDGRHEPFLRKVGTKQERKAIEKFQKEILLKRDEIEPMLKEFCDKNNLKFRIPLSEVLDYCVLEYPFALWQWGTSVSTIPSADSASTTDLFNHLIAISGPDYFAVDGPNVSFFVQAAKELGYYGYDTKPLRKLLSIDSSKGYLNKIMLPDECVDKISFSSALYEKVYNFLKDNDPKMIFIYGEIDPWSAPRVPTFKGKKNEQIYIQKRGSHLSRIGNMPTETKNQIMNQINEWLAD